MQWNVNLADWPVKASLCLDGWRQNCEQRRPRHLSLSVARPAHSRDCMSCNISHPMKQKCLTFKIKYFSEFQSFDLIYSLIKIETLKWQVFSLEYIFFCQDKLSTKSWMFDKIMFSRVSQYRKFSEECCVPLKVFLQPTFSWGCFSLREPFFQQSIIIQRKLSEECRVPLCAITRDKVSNTSLGSNKKW